MDNDNVKKLLKKSQESKNLDSENLKIHEIENKKIDTDLKENELQKDGNDISLKQSLALIDKQIENNETKYWKEENDDFPVDFYLEEENIKAEITNDSKQTDYGCSEIIKISDHTVVDVAFVTKGENYFIHNKRYTIEDWSLVRINDDRHQYCLQHILPIESPEVNIGKVEKTNTLRHFLHSINFHLQPIEIPPSSKKTKSQNPTTKPTQSTKPTKVSQFTQVAKVANDNKKFVSANIDHRSIVGGMPKGNVVNCDLKQVGLLSMTGDSVGIKPQKATTAVTNLDAVPSPLAGEGNLFNEHYGWEVIRRNWIFSTEKNIKQTLEDDFGLTPSEFSKPHYTLYSHLLVKLFLRQKIRLE
ncbi:MAG: hypothetical protein PVI90_02400 [Desulfobacteraceae bacterium]